MLHSTLRFKIFCLVLNVLAVGLSGRAEAAEKSDFERVLEQNQFTETRERWIEKDGVKYREITIDNKPYYLKFTSRDSQVAEIDCALENPLTSPSHLEVSQTVFRRTRIFVQLVRETCSTIGGKKVRILKLDPRFGFTIPDAPNSILKNKQLYWGGSGLGFLGEW